MPKQKGPDNNPGLFIGNLYVTSAVFEALSAPFFDPSAAKNDDA